MDVRASRAPAQRRLLVDEHFADREQLLQPPTLQGGPRVQVPKAGDDRPRIGGAAALVRERLDVCGLVAARRAADICQPQARHAHQPRPRCGAVDLVIQEDQQRGEVDGFPGFGEVQRAETAMIARSRVNHAGTEAILEKEDVALLPRHQCVFEVEWQQADRGLLAGAEWPKSHAMHARKERSQEHQQQHLVMGFDRLHAHAPPSAPPAPLTEERSAHKEPEFP